MAHFITLNTSCFPYRNQCGDTCSCCPWKHIDHVFCSSQPLRVKFFARTDFIENRLVAEFMILMADQKMLLMRSQECDMWLVESV